MISVQEARDIIKNSVIPMPMIIRSLADASGYILAKDVMAKSAIPAFDQSAMDGYCFSFDQIENTFLTLNGEMAAGASALVKLGVAEACRIFTGAPIAAGSDTVVMQEKTELKFGRLYIRDPHILKGANVRKEGESIRKGTLVLKSGAVLTPAAIGLLASVGEEKVSVLSKPKVAIITTGNELIQPGSPIGFGEIYDVNSFSITSALNRAGISDEQIGHMHAPDNLDSIKSMLYNALNSYDIVLLTGGVSVGDYDFVSQAAIECGVEPLFHKIKQKPGKPLFFGKKGNKLIFGLPGNPASALSCFYLYVQWALDLLCGKPYAVKIKEVVSAVAMQKPVSITYFIPGFFDEENKVVYKAMDQGSNSLRSFALSNCLIELGEECSGVEKGAYVRIHQLPGY